MAKIVNAGSGFVAEQVVVAKKFIINPNSSTEHSETEFSAEYCAEKLEKVAAMKKIIDAMDIKGENGETEIYNLGSGQALEEVYSGDDFVINQNSGEHKAEDSKKGFAKDVAITAIPVIGAVAKAVLGA